MIISVKIVLEIEVEVLKTHGQNHCAKMIK